MAKTICTIYKDQKQLNTFIQENHLKNFPHLLVHIFSQISDDLFLQKLENSIKKLLPESTFVNFLTAERISEDHVSEDKVYLSFTTFNEDDIQQLNENLYMTEQYYRSLFENNADFVYSTDLEGTFTSVNPAFIRTFGVREQDVVGKSAFSFIKQEEIPRVKKHFFDSIRGNEQYFNLELPIKGGDKQLFQIKNIPITVNGYRMGTYGIGRNITEQKKIEERIIQLAYYDHDTGLPNRMKFSELLDSVIYNAKKNQQMFAVLFIDMDRFKLINDSLGHYAGDLILKELAVRIQEHLPEESIFGRFGGDKFTLLLTKDVSIEGVMDTSRKILKNVAKPVFYDNLEYFITASIGIGLFPNDGLDEQTLLKNADIAMNRSKNNGGNRITFYSTEMNEQALLRLELESYLRKALQKREFYLCYQPLIDLLTGETSGTEALIRWKHPKLGLISPATFIPLAEETGIIKDIGAWVLLTACKQTKDWHDKGLGRLSISVNVSAYQFQLPTFISEVAEALRESNLDPKYLTLELTESVMLRNIDHSIVTMRALQDMGVKVSIDDFGTGYSSLSYLRNLPINILKIDRSFINNLGLGHSDLAIVKAIITMGQGLDIKVVAEGVETKSQIDLLRELECNYAQGYFINKPLLTSEFEERLRTRNQLAYVTE